MMLTLARRLAVTAVALTGVLTVPAVASAAGSTSYGGTTSQRLGGSPLRLTLTVSHGAVSNVQAPVFVNKGPANCVVNVSSTSFVFNKGKAKVNRNHKFTGKLTDGHGDSMTITGLAKSSRVTGSFIVSAPGGAAGAVTCNSGKVTFSAQGSGGQADHTKYSGTIGPGFPISFRVSANGKAVESLVLNYEVTTCGGAPGNVAPTYHFRTLAIKSGSFSGSQSEGSKGDSLLIRINGTFFGRVVTGTITGTQHITGLGTCTESIPFTAKAK